MQIRERTPDDDPGLVALHHEAEPHLPPVSVEEFRAQLDSIPAQARRVMLVGEQGGSIVARANLMEAFWTGVPGTFHVGLGVAVEHRGAGLGASMYVELLARARQWDARKLYVDVSEDEPAGLAFAQRRGFEHTGHVARVSRLDVNAAHDQDATRLADDLAAQGIRVDRLIEHGAEDEQSLRAVHEVSMRTALDEPAAEPYNVTFEQWLEMIRTTPGLSNETVWVATKDGRPIGLTMLRRQGYDAGFQFSMGVEADYRGRGIARLLKMRQIEWARMNGLAFLFTSNDSNNPRMYDINVRLGYKPLPAYITLVLSLI